MIAKNTSSTNKDLNYLTKQSQINNVSVINILALIYIYTNEKLNKIFNKTTATKSIIAINIDMYHIYLTWRSMY